LDLRDLDITADVLWIFEECLNSAKILLPAPEYITGVSASSQDSELRTELEASVSAVLMILEEQTSLR
jgi:hypothetical protein